MTVTPAPRAVDGTQRIEVAAPSSRLWRCRSFMLFRPRPCANEVWAGARGNQITSPRWPVTQRSGSRGTDNRRRVETPATRGRARTEHEHRKGITIRAWPCSLLEPATQQRYDQTMSNNSSPAFCLRNSLAADGTAAQIQPASGSHCPNIGRRSRTSAMAILKRPDVTSTTREVNKRLLQFFDSVMRVKTVAVS